MGKKKSDPHKLFNLAYDKATSGRRLTEEEERELLRYLYPWPFQAVPCDECGEDTNDRDRPNEPSGARICGTCLVRMSHA